MYYWYPFKSDRLIDDENASLMSGIVGVQQKMYRQPLLNELHRVAGDNSGENSFWLHEIDKTKKVWQQTK